MPPTGSSATHSQPSPASGAATLGGERVDPSDEALRVDARRAGEQHCVITVAGELDVATAPALVSVVQDVLAEAPECLVIDLDRVTFLDSTGLGVLVSTYRRMHAQPGGLVLVCHTRACLRVMEITALTRVFTFAPSVEEAVSGSVSRTDSTSTTG